MPQNQLFQTLQRSITDNSRLPALSDFNGSTATYGELAGKIAHIHMMLSSAGIKTGDKVALCARNSAEWAATFLGALSYGAVVVPILHEFHPDNIEHLVNHSEAKILFSEKQIADNLDTERMPGLEALLLIPGYEPAVCRNDKLACLLENFDEAFSRIHPTWSAADLKFADPAPDTVALINYTSGSTGNSKGVMLTYGNLWSNIRFAINNIPFLHPGDGMLSMLPLAHMYGLVFEFLFPLALGCHITFLGRIPSPQIVLKAFAQVKPKLVITVPLVIEKIIKGKVFPVLRKPAVRLLTAIPGVRNVIYSRIRKQLLDAFGGRLEELILGGAALSSEVEELLRTIRFPFTVGYGMTECAPLLTYCYWSDQRPHSCGKMVDGMEARIASKDAANVPGVLFVRGANVMKGYYKNPEATAEALDKDGWLNTGDVCTIDADGYVYIRGRNKSMILGPSGQNIYPEEIEVKLNNLPLVGESIVVDRDGRIVALIHPDYDQGRKLGLTEDETEKKVMDNLPVLNKMLPAYSRVSAFEIHRDEFEKTPKHSIRRFIYK